MTESKQICGADLLRSPQLNRADAFTQEERDARGLEAGEDAAAGRDLAAAEDPVEPDEVE
mgnify:CR=1 FL=1